MKTAATAVFADTYFGRVPVRLVRSGQRWLWVSDKCVSTGYRPVGTVQRAIRLAMADRRFADVVAAP
jgi:hypothetical protein